MYIHGTIFAYIIRFIDVRMSCSSDSDFSSRSSRRKQKSPRKTFASYNYATNQDEPVTVKEQTLDLSDPKINLWSGPFYTQNGSNASPILSEDTIETDGDVKPGFSTLVSSTRPCEFDGQHRSLFQQDDSSLTCAECKRSFVSKLQLEVHKIVGHDMRQKHQCGQCKLYFPLKTVLSRHIKSAHSSQSTGAGHIQSKTKAPPSRTSFFMEQKKVYAYKKVSLVLLLFSILFQY